MEEQELRDIIRQELEDARQPATMNVQDVVRTAVQETLITLGMDASDPLELQQDMHFLREIREAHERMKNKGLLIVIGMVTTAAVAAIGLGLKEMLTR